MADTLARVLSIAALNNGGGGDGQTGPTGPAGPQGPTGPAGTYSAGTGISIANDTVSYQATPLWAVYSDGTLNLYTSNPNA